MKTIFKYPLKLTVNQTIDLPQTNKILSVKEQDGTLCLWALVDTETPPTICKIRIHGTGHEVHAPSACLDFIDTVLCENGLVWHVFKEI